MNNNSRNLNPNLMYTSSNYTNFTNQSNPMGNFKPTTTNNKNLNNYDVAFTENNPILNRHDFRNSHNTLHNNLADSLVNEHVTEYRVSIDANDRDSKIYPNPFKFTVTFGPPSRQSINEKVLIDPNDPSKGKTIIKTYVDGMPNPCINRTFKNVKYVKIESLVLPKFNRIVNDSGDYAIDASLSLDDDRFLFLEIPELRSNNTLGTNTNAENNFIIFPDRIYTAIFTGMTFYANKVFDDNSLGNIERLTFIIKDSFGKIYDLKIVDPSGKVLPEKPDINRENSTKLNCVYHKIFQTHITLIIGVVENQLNTITKYDK